MKKASQNIHPIFDQLLQRRHKEAQLGQRSLVVWATGLSGSGKSTIAKGLEAMLHQNGFFCMVLDGDNVRAGINSNLGFSNDDRSENIRRIAEVAKLFVNCGIITVCSFVSPTVSMRRQAREIIGEKDFAEVFVNTPLEICEARDVKGLYKKARKGEIKGFTGIDAPFEPPPQPDLEILTQNQSVEQSVQSLYDFLLPKISAQSP